MFVSSYIWCILLNLHILVFYKNEIIFATMCLNSSFLVSDVGTVMSNPIYVFVLLVITNDVNLIYSSIMWYQFQTKTVIYLIRKETFND